MASLNKVFLMGNLTRDPELRYLQSGSAKLSAGIAVNRKYRNRNQEMVEETTFVDIEGWGPQAETFSRYLSKGRAVFIEGRLRFDTWEGKDGQKRSKLLVVMDNFQFLGSPADRGQASSSAPRAGRSQVRAGQAADRGDAGQAADRGDAGQAADRGDAGQVADRSDAGQAEDYDFDDIPF